MFFLDAVLEIESIYITALLPSQEGCKSSSRKCTVSKYLLSIRTKQAWTWIFYNIFSEQQSTVIVYCTSTIINNNKSTINMTINIHSNAAEQLLSAATTQSDTVVLIGSGGREHALAVALAQSPHIKEVIVCPGNGGTKAEGGKISNAVDSDGKHISKQDNDTVLELVKRVNAKMVVVGPAQPLVDGVVDVLAVECPSVKVFGPSKAGAELEASKVSIV